MKNKKRKELQTLGGVDPQIGGISSIFGPMFKALFDFSWERVCALTNIHGVHQIWAFRLPSVAMWHSWIMSVW